MFCELSNNYNLSGKCGWKKRGIGDLINDKITAIFCFDRKQGSLWNCFESALHAPLIFSLSAWPTKDQLA